MTDEENNRQFIVEVGQMLDDTHTICGVLALESIKFGSPLTGAPGQPVDTSNLINSWTMERESPTSIVIGTPVEYADAIEEGIQEPYTTKNGTQVTPKPMTLRSAQGGFHSVAHTVTNFDRIVEHAKDLVLRGGGNSGNADGGARRG